MRNRESETELLPCPMAKRNVPMCDKIWAFLEKDGLCLWGMVKMLKAIHT